MDLTNRPEGATYYDVDQCLWLKRSLGKWLSFREKKWSRDKSITAKTNVLRYNSAEPSEDWFDVKVEMGLNKNHQKRFDNESSDPELVRKRHNAEAIAEAREIAHREVSPFEEQLFIDQISAII